MGAEAEVWRRRDVRHHNTHGLPEGAEQWQMLCQRFDGFPVFPAAGQRPEMPCATAASCSAPGATTLHECGGLPGALECDARGTFRSAAFAFRWACRSCGASSTSTVRQVVAVTPPWRTTRRGTAVTLAPLPQSRTQECTQGDFGRRGEHQNPMDFWAPGLGRSPLARGSWRSDGATCCSPTGPSIPSDYIAIPTVPLDCRDGAAIGATAPEPTGPRNSRCCIGPCPRDGPAAGARLDRSLAHRARRPLCGRSRGASLSDRHPPRAEVPPEAKILWNMVSPRRESSYRRRLS